MKPRAFKFMFFIIIIILIIIALFILYINGDENTVRAEGKKLDSVISNNLSIGLVNFDSLNPHISQNQDVQYISKLIYKDLIGISENFELVPSLAKEWSEISANVYIIKLNENEYWHNGEKFTAKDIEFTISKLKSETLNSIYKENVKNIENVEIIDDYTLKIHTYEDEDFFEYNLCIPILKYNSEDEIIGTGDYKVREITNNYIILEKTKENNVPRKIRINLYNSYSELYSAFSQEKVDIITTSNINFNNFVGTIDLNEEKIRGRELIYLKINTSEDINIRKAISCAINKDEIIYKVFNNKYFCADNPLDNGNYLGQTNNQDDYNLNNAKKYIMSSGWKENNGVWIRNKNILNMNLNIRKDNENHSKIAQELKTQLEKAGIKIDIVELSEKDYNYKMEDNSYEMILCEDILPIFPDINKYLNTDDVEVRKLLDKAVYVKDIEILKETYKEILEQYKDEKSIKCLSFNSIIILHNSNVKGNFKGNWYNIFYNIDTWYKDL